MTPTYPAPRFIPERNVLGPWATRGVKGPARATRARKLDIENRLRRILSSPDGLPLRPEVSNATFARQTNRPGQPGRRANRSLNRSMSITRILPAITLALTMGAPIAGCRQTG